MRVRFGFDFDEAGMASGLNTSILSVKTAENSIGSASSTNTVVLIAQEASGFGLEKSEVALRSNENETSPSSAITHSNFSRSFGGVGEIPSAGNESAQSTGSFNNGALQGCMCCGGGGGGITGSNAATSYAGSSDVMGASGPGLTARLTQYWDAGDNRYEFSGNQEIDAVLIGSKWTITNLTFSFPTSGAFYPTPYYDAGIPANLVVFNAAQQNAARYALALIGGYTNLAFTEVTETAAVHGNIRMAQTTDASVGSAHGNFPGSQAWDGDIWFGMTGQPFYLTPQIGNWGMATIMHEIGHTMGLKHGHQDYTTFDLVPDDYIDGPGPRFGTRALPTSHDGWAWSLMTYRSDPGNSVQFEGEGFNQPQTFMQNDIAALQYMYGADFTYNSGNSVYTFNVNTGEMFINGVSQGVPTTSGGLGKIFRTIWDGGGTDTYDFSNFTGNQTIDLDPGAWSTMSTARLANTRAYSGGSSAAPGNIANALLYNNDTRSLIENVEAGIGNDSIYGNTANNNIDGGDGDDYIDGWSGNDTLDGWNGDDVILGYDGNDLIYGYLGDDTLYGEAGNDTLRGEGGNDSLSGGSGNDSLVGSTGFDTMAGSTGNDTYAVDSVSDSVTEAADAGTDLVSSSISYTLGANLENLTLTGGNVDGTGNSLSNIITGSSGNNAINAGAGNDTVNASGGNDTITDTEGMGAGDDDVYDGGDGIDTLVHDLNWVSSVTFDLASGFATFGGNRDQLISIENLVIGGSASVVGSGVANAITVNGTGSNAINAGAGNDTVNAGGGNDTITDTQGMGAGDDDVYDGGAGTDTLVHDLNWVSSVTFDLAAGFTTFGGNRDQLISIENLVIGGSASVVGSGVANSITVNGTGANAINAGAGNDTVSAGGGNDTITDTEGMGAGDDDVYDGGDGIDTLVHDLNWVSSVTFDLAAGFATFGGNRDQLISIENLVIGGSASVVGSGVANAITVNGTGANAINAGAGNDTVNAGGGNDTITDTQGMGAADDDVYDGGDGTDTLVHDLNWVSSVTFDLAAGFATFGGNRDQLISIENLVIGGSASVVGSGVANSITVNGTGANAINAGGGNDTVNAGGGNDTITDTGVMLSSDDDVYDGGDGIDTLVHDLNWVSSVTFDLAAGYATYGGNRDQLISIENLVIGGSASVVGSGVANSITVNGTGANSINAGGGNDTVNAGGGDDAVIGDDGDDVLNGEAGNDSISGAVGNDTISGAAGNDTINAGTTSDGTDTVDGGEGDDVITSSGQGSYNGGTGNDYIYAGLTDSNPEVLDGGADNDTVDTALWSGDYSINLATGAVPSYPNETFLNFENAITGAGNDSIAGTTGANLIDGGSGNDTMAGLAGNDTYFVRDTGDNVVEASGEGTDTIVSTVSYSLSGRYVEFLTLVGSGNITAKGNSQAQTLTGNSGNNRLDGLAGFDTMLGGLGDDTFVVDNAGDSVVEAAAEGTDTVESSITFTLAGLQVENLTLIGSSAINGTGNTVGNVLVGNSGVNVISGLTGDDTYYIQNTDDNVVEASGEGTDTIFSTVSYSLSGRYVEFLTLVGSANINAKGNSQAQTLTGNSGNNRLEGLGGSDRLDGLGGFDTMLGGLGDDTFVVDNAGDSVVEAAAEGTDTVESSISFTLAGLQVENLTLIGSSAINGTGNTVGNVLVGNSGVNVISGLTGDDTYYIQNTGDTVVEASGEGTDTIFSTVSYSLSGMYVEFLTLLGSANINAKGNSQVQTLTGNSGNNRLDGLAGSDTMLGGLGDDTFVVDSSGDSIVEAASEGTDTVESSVSFTLVGLQLENLTLTGSSAINGTGNSLANVLVGSSGVNVLSGQTGDDTYFIQNSGDNVVELLGEGTDTIYSAVTYSLTGRYVEAIILTGSANVNATGNSMTNSLTGNNGNNTLNGKGGADNLTGGLGSDLFLFESGSGADTVTDFVAAQNDTININAYTSGVANASLVSESGGNVVINLGGGNIITVLTATQADVLAHIVW